MTLYTIISTILIPAIVWLLRKAKLPAKWCPLAAFVVAGALVGLGKVFGADVGDVNTLAQAILTALTTAGVAVLGYDTVSKLIK